VKNKFLKLLLSSQILLIISLLIKSISFAEELSIKDIVISGDISEIRVSSFLKGNLDSDILETIKSGIPTTFTYYIELYKKQSLRFDKKISSKTVKNTVEYDNLKKEYRAIQDINKETKNSLLKNINEAESWIRGLNNIPIADDNVLRVETPYYLKVKAKLKSIKFIFPLNYVLFFFSVFDKDTEWQKSPLFSIKESL